MAELKICRVCLRTESKMYKYDLFQLKHYYEEVMALKINDNDNLPQNFCYECAMMLHKFHKFKEKCYIGLKTLKELLWKGALNYENIYKIDCKSKNLQSTLEVVKLIDSTVYILDEDINIRLPVKNKSQNFDTNEYYFNDYSMIDEQAHKTSNINDIDEQKLHIDGDVSETMNTEVNSSHVNFVDANHVYKEGNIDKECKRRKKKRKLKYLSDLSNWKLYNLTEEEALKEFRARAMDSKYLSANYKCMDCFRWFSKADMLERHRRFRHSELMSGYECRFCRMKYKWKCDLRKHIQQHYTKYECLRCNLICMRENTVRLHEEYHSGVTRKCQYCDQEFRHISTYYTHLRTHRSEHVCVACGASFVSQAGLHQHKKLKHTLHYVESPDDDEEVNTHCEKCEIMFETRKAYEEHLFHSAMHTEGLKNGEDTEAAVPMKVLRKNIKEKIIKKLRTSKVVEDMFTASPKNRRRKVRKRIRRKPTTCYQCGKHFETQAACMKHHLAEHPRTSFHAPAERHICEICGASLAPGSVTVHLNIHTRRSVHACGTCGRQFHSSAGLKRHLVAYFQALLNRQKEYKVNLPPVRKAESTEKSRQETLTHTGEKRYSCAHCEKKFTQSNSMKLHYRTFHLKEPYPKRNRRKKKEPQKSIDTEEMMSSEESDTSLPEPGIEPSLTNHLAIEPVPDAVPVIDENMHYLRL